MSSSRTGDRLPADLESVHRFSSRHRELLTRSARAGCFYCCRFVDPNAVLTWIDDGETALCPQCEIDALLPDAAPIRLDQSLLAAMHAYWFGRRLGDQSC